MDLCIVKRKCFIKEGNIYKFYFFVLNGWKAAGIYDALKLGSSKLPSIDPLIIDSIALAQM